MDLFSGGTSLERLETLVLRGPAGLTYPVTARRSLSLISINLVDVPLNEE